MEVYFGGAFQGKLDYVLKKKGNLRVARNLAWLVVEQPPEL